MPTTPQLLVGALFHVAALRFWSRSKRWCLRLSSVIYVKNSVSAAGMTTVIEEPLCCVWTWRSPGIFIFYFFVKMYHHAVHLSSTRGLLVQHLASTFALVHTNSICPFLLLIKVVVQFIISKTRSSEGSTVA